MDFFTYILQNKEQISFLFFEHIQLTIIAMGIAILIGVPLGILISYAKNLSKAVLGAVNVIQAIPSLALLGIAIPLLGIGKLPAIIVVMLYSLLPIVKNTFTGISNINPQTVEAAQGIGLTNMQVLTKVEIPLALPIIMAGVRIAAVTAVGMMTIAAFIGAGGLGFLVFSGISTVNNNLILAGAIPACVLALLVDFVAGQIEKAVTPGRSSSKTGQKKRSKKFLYGVCVLLIAALAYTLVTGISADKNRIIVGGKDFTEQHVLTHLVAELIENNTELEVERKVNLGGTQVCFSALKSGAIDIYVEYSGTAYVDTLGYKPIGDMNKVYETVKKDFKDKFDIRVLKQMLFNNTYTLSTTQEIAEKFGLKKISDLQVSAKNMIGGFTFEFHNREDCLPGMEKYYSFSFKDSKAINGSQRYLALDNGNVDIIDAFATDGLLKKFKLVTLEDDKNFFPPYYAIPLMRGEVAQKHPELVKLLEALGPFLTSEAVIDLNYKVDELQMDSRTVAVDFLKEHKLIK